MNVPLHFTEIDRYGLEINKIYNEDCMVGMERIKDKSIDMILCDLPYGTTQNKWDSILPLNDYIETEIKGKIKQLKEDEYLLYCYKNNISLDIAKKEWKSKHKKGLWTHYNRIIKDNGAIVLTANQPFTAKLIASNPSMFKYAWCWEKSLKTNFLNAKKQPLRNHEDVLVFYKKQCTYNPQGLKKGSISGGNKVTGSYNAWKSNSKKQMYTGYPSSVLKITNPNNGNIHPTQKPIELFEYLIKTYTNEGDIVLDNCIGSGTTAIACIKTKRNYIGWENDTKHGYYQKSIERINNYDY